MTLRVFIHAPEKLDLADEIQDEFHEAAKAAIGEAADILLADVKRRLQLRRGHQSAPAGEPPVMRTGDLLRSYKRIPPRVRGAVASSGIRSNDEGSNRLEHGFTDARGIRTLPHPHVRPAVEATAEEIDRLLQDRLG